MLNFLLLYVLLDITDTDIDHGGSQMSGVGRVGIKFHLHRLSCPEESTRSSE